MPSVKASFLFFLPECQQKNPSSFDMYINFDNPDPNPRSTIRWPDKSRHGPQTHNNRLCSIGRERQHERRRPIQVPICLRWRGVSPCYTAVPLGSLWHIRRWVLSIVSVPRSWYNPQKRYLHSTIASTGQLSWQ